MKKVLSRLVNKNDTFFKLRNIKRTSLAKIPPILLKAGICIPYFSNSLLMALISSSRKEKRLKKDIRFCKLKLYIGGSTLFTYSTLLVFFPPPHPSSSSPLPNINSSFLHPNPTQPKPTHPFLPNDTPPTIIHI